MDINWENTYCFCKLNCINDYKEINFKNTFLENLCLKFKKVLFWFVKNKTPFYFNECNIGNFKGIEIFIPIVKEDIVYNKELYYYLISEAKYFLSSLDFNLEHLEFINEIFPEKQNLYKLKLLFLNDLINLGKDKLTSKEQYNYMFILGDDDYYNKLAILSAVEDGYDTYIYNKKNSEVINEFIDYIFNETGMYISIINDKSTFVNSIINCDIVVNLKDIDEKLAHKLKGESLFIDLTKKSINANAIKKQREDVNVINDFFLTMDNKPITIIDTHKILKLIDKNYIDYLSGIDLSFTSSDIFEKYNIKIKN